MLYLKYKYLFLEMIIIISAIYLFTFQLIINELANLDYLNFLAFNYIFWIVVIPPLASICYQFDVIFIGASQTAEMRNGMFVSTSIFIISSLLFLSILFLPGVK